MKKEEKEIKEEKEEQKRQEEKEIKEEKVKTKEEYINEICFSLLKLKIEEREELVEKYNDLKICIKKAIEIGLGRGNNKYNLEKIYELSEKIYRHSQENNIEIITYFDEIYPDNLRKIYDPPYLLYAKGNLSYLKIPQLAIIGARKASINTLKVTTQIVSVLSKKNYSIISGLAVGVDGVSHKSAIAHNIPTIGVLGMGISKEVFYPKENLKLFEDMCKNSLVISEYPYYQNGTKYTFPARNRIIAGICDKIIIVQASKKSGTLITAEFAYENGKEIYTTTGDILDERFEGNYDLIADGAEYISKISDIEILL